ncbi:alanine racemase [Pseudactinotalea sp. Z1748]|uniref:alanine racemase n=1 Tax=Pseudactinotalea sp. Z1748 TaxID=3413027 RepID=UPI003C7AD80C
MTFHDPAVEMDWLAVDVPTPSLLLDLDILDHNIDEMARLSKEAGVSLLPHAKTHRIGEVGIRQIQRGATGLTVASVAEAEGFAAAGIDSLFIANPAADEHKFARCLQLSTICDLTLAIDTFSGAVALAHFFASRKARIKVMMGVDSGLHREGVRPEDAPDLARRVNALDGIDLVGIYTHEGTVYGAQDPEDVVRRSRLVAQEMVTTAERIRQLDIALPIVSMGASASARVCATVPGVTQIRPGIYAFNDAGQVALGNASPETVAVRVIATVTGHPEPGRAYIDAGSKALSTDLLPAATLRGLYPGHGIIVNAPGWVIERVSEEHGWLRWYGDGEPPALPVGTRLEIIPNHVCMAFAMLRCAYVIRSGEIEKYWETFGAGS